jgi:hypothetical protein
MRQWLKMCRTHFSFLRSQHPFKHIGFESIRSRIGPGDQTGIGILQRSKYYGFGSELHWVKIVDLKLWNRTENITNPHSHPKLDGFRRKEQRTKKKDGCMPDDYILALPKSNRLRGIYPFMV